MGQESIPSVFVLGRDYHLGDLLWFTAVLLAYRRALQPSSVTVVLPDRPISRILENHPLIDRLVYGEGTTGPMHPPQSRQVRVHDLRILPIAITMVRQWRRRLPWLYYRDLWLAPRGQWLATFLAAGTIADHRPTVQLCDCDREAAARIPRPYIALSPHTGQFSIPLVSHGWRALKGWSEENWTLLAAGLRQQGFAVVTLAADGQSAVPGTTPVVGLPIRQAAGVIERAAALVTGESGMWFVAAAFGTPFVVVPWWLPQEVDWAAPMHTPYQLVSRADASVQNVLQAVSRLAQRKSIEHV